MKKIGRFLMIASLTAGLMPSCMISRQSDKQEETRSITVTGSGSVTVRPDIISLKFIVRNSGWNIVQVAERNAINTRNTLNALKEVGILESDISTYDYTITQDNTHTYAGEYTAQNTIAVIVRNPDITGSVIDAAVKNNIGANGITSFEYIVSDKTSALREARTMAVKNAQDAASLLAGASGCKINGVLEITENYTSSGRAADAMFKAMPMSMDASATITPIEQGDVTITSNVTIKYGLTN